MPHPSRLCAAALLAASLGGCQALGGGGGVMPESELGPPPSMRGSLPARATRSAQVDDDAPIATRPTRSLELPKNVRGETRTADTGPRRIRREEIDGEPAAQSSSGGLAPQMGAGGSVGLGGKF